MVTWNVGLIVDPDFKAFAMLAEHMPLWVIASPQNLVQARVLRSTANRGRINYTTFKAISSDLTSVAVGMLPTVELHHPDMTAVSIFGLESSDTLDQEMIALGYLPAKAEWENCIAFRRTPDLINAAVLHLNAETWKSINDVYEALFVVLKSPVFHGKNFNAGKDSIVTGQINQIEVPYHLVVHHASHVPCDVQAFLSEFTSLILVFQQMGCPVSINIED